MLKLILNIEALLYYIDLVVCQRFSIRGVVIPWSLKFTPDFKK